jgi:CHAD domain-containing protein
MNPLLKTADDYRGDLRKAWNNARTRLDEESIHDLRVATRRMNSALLLLETVLEEDRSSKARRRTKRVMKKLGPLRDIQVQITLVKKWKASTRVTRFLQWLEETEQRHRRGVRDYLATDRRKKVLREVKDFQRKAEKRLKDMPQASVTARLTAAIAQQRRNVETALQNVVASDPASLHALRIASRKLRYCLEAAAKAVGTPHRSEVEKLRQKQTELGHERDLHLLDEKYKEWKENGTA